MPSPLWKETLKRLPFSRRIERSLLEHGHTEKEAETGALFVAFLDLFLLILLVNSFLAGVLLSLPHRISVFARTRPVETVLTCLGFTLLLLAVLFRLQRNAEERKRLEERQVRRAEMDLRTKRDALGRGAMADFETVLRAELKRMKSDLELLSVNVVDTTPRLRFRMERFTTARGGDVDGNYRLFREKLFADTLDLVAAAFRISPNIPAVLVDAIFQFVSRKAQFYDGAVLSVKASREVFRTLDLKAVPPFKALASFDLRYNDGSEVEAHPEEESKSARILERLHRQMPKADIRYEAAVVKADDGWKEAEAAAPAEPSKEDASDPGKLPPDRFFSFVSELLARQGFDVQKTRKIPGGTMEVLARHPHPILGGDFVALARQYPPDAQVHAEMVRELDQLVRDEQCQRGLYLITGRFTDESVNIARKMPVTLVDGRLLKDLASRPGEAASIPAGVPGPAPDLNGMSLTAFQDQVGAFLKGLGFQLEKIRKMTDGAIFARVVESHPLIGGQFAVLARQAPERAEVSAEAVREMGRIMEAEFCRRGILLVTASFSGEARTLARTLSVDLVDRGQWLRLFTGP